MDALQGAIFSSRMDALSDEELIYESVNEYLATGKAIEREEKKPEMKKEKQSTKQRELNKEAIQAAKVEAKQVRVNERIQGLMEEAIKAAKIGIPWRMFYTQKNIARLPRKDAVKIKAIFDTNLNSK